MNTPAHTILSLLVLGRNETRPYIYAIVLGSLLPDIPMFLFFFVERIVFDVPMQIIWKESYYLPWWQNFFDAFNSIPLILIGGLVAHRVDSKWWQLFFFSMLLHVLFDLPLHHDDSHRHFFPFSDWRFSSPVSYWDPDYHGTPMAILEGVFAISGCIVLMRRHSGLMVRLVLSLVSVFFLAHVIFAISRHIN
jgi:hypothetical protein